MDEYNRDNNTKRAKTQRPSPTKHSSSKTALISNLDPVEQFRDEYSNGGGSISKDMMHKNNRRANTTYDDDGSRQPHTPRKQRISDKVFRRDPSKRPKAREQQNVPGPKNAGAAPLDGYYLDETSNNNNHNNPVEEEEVYIVQQETAYLSYGFSLVQTIIMALLMWQCGMAPISINPMLGPYPDALSEWGGKNSTLIVEDGEWWRLLTPILLHAGWFHLLGNVAVQLEAGAFFEKEWGSIRWLIVYLGSAVASSALSVICMPQAVSVGSSGAVMGLFGGKLAEVVLRCCERTDTPERQVSSKVRREQCCTVTCSVIVVLAFSFIPYVDWAAHLGGLLGGIVVGLALFAFELEYTVCKCVWLILGIAATGASYYAALWYMYNGDLDMSEDLRDVCGYYKEQFEDYECKCMVDQYINNGGGGGGGGGGND
ncbi:hypothetical protein ACA910_018848 [Epithemia clementina (nom. ined.)]